MKDHQTERSKSKTVALIDNIISPFVQIVKDPYLGSIKFIFIPADAGIKKGKKEKKGKKKRKAEKKQTLNNLKKFTNLNKLDKNK